MSDLINQNQGISKIVKTQVRQWEEACKSHPTRLAGGAEIDFITIGRQIGSGGEEVAHILAEMMQWRSYDKDILDYLAEDMKVHKSMIECVDERTIGWIEDWIAPFFSRKTSRPVPQLQYFKHLTKVLLVIAKLGKAIIVGRAAGLILPRDRGLSVWVIAPFELRCRRYAQENHISVDEATSMVKKADREQAGFARDLLNRDISDSQYYDIICNTEKLSPTSVGRLIWRALDQRVVSAKERAEIAEVAAQKTVQ